MSEGMLDHTHPPRQGFLSGSGVLHACLLEGQSLCAESATPGSAVVFSASFHSVYRFCHDTAEECQKAYYSGCQSDFPDALAEQ